MYESSDTFISVLLLENGNHIIFVAKTKNHMNMRNHQKEMLLIAGYSIAIVGHLMLITWLSLLLNHSLNII